MDPKKKSLSATERDETARAAWRETIATVDPRQCLFIDECGTHLAHTRLYARAPRGERAVGSVPKNRGRVTTLIASLSATGVGPVMTLPGGTSKAVFVTWVREALVPTLGPGQVVILDNLGAHRPSIVRELIEATGARLLYLPGYSPDCNPIELAFGKLKAWLKRVGARTRDDLDAAIADALSSITLDDIRGFFTHCGYPLTGQSL